MTQCILFGCILSATDPVAVVALLKELGARLEFNLFIGVKFICTAFCMWVCVWVGGVSSCVVFALLWNRNTFTFHLSCLTLFLSFHPRPPFLSPPLLSPPLPPSPLLSRSRGSLLPPPFRLYSINLFSEELATTIEGESLLNDGTAVVLFTILLKNLENVYSFQPVLNGGDITYLAIRLSLGPLDELL